MIDILSEDVIRLEDAKKVLPGRPDRATLYRWALKGAEGVKLATVKCGRGRFTSKQACQRFVEALTVASDGETAPAIRTSRKRQQDATAAAERLKAAGILN